MELWIKTYNQSREIVSKTRFKTIHIALRSLLQRWSIIFLKDYTEKFIHSNFYVATNQRLKINHMIHETRKSFSESNKTFAYYFLIKFKYFHLKHQCLKHTLCLVMAMDEQSIPLHEEEEFLIKILILSSLGRSISL